MKPPPPGDGDPLSEMKRLVLFNAMKNNPERGSAIAVGIGSTGKWMRRQQANQYDAANPDSIVDYKLKGLYMEGLSDLDFPVMGERAIAYTQQFKAILKQGGIGDDDLERLEISLIVDDQIDNIDADGDPRRFWNQMLDVERSSSHSEKYLTKGGKALYCMEHLIESGSTLIDGEAAGMKEWAAGQGHELGPFGVQFLLGGCADMDYFLRHACEKDDQERAKTILQLVKYSKRQRWMMAAAIHTEQSLRRLESVGLSVSQVNDLLKQLQNNIESLDELVRETREDKPWSSGPYFKAYKEEFKRLSALSCCSSHRWSLVIGNALLDKVHAKQATEKQINLLYQIAYDMETMHLRRYPHGYPKPFDTDAEGCPYWYTKTQQAKTMEFLDRFKHGRAIAEETWPERPMPWRTVMTPMEIGPIVPPPFATIEVSATAVPLVDGIAYSTRSNAPVRHQIAIQGRVNGLSKSKPGDPPLWQVPRISPAKLQVMQELTRDLREAEFLAFKFRHLLQLVISV
ncbi:hypothetical protein [Novipirellula artificiosorum]|uniref:Uncharacterized protein n=1 Tax=Novipirellula artificiosorum TaxID=2528016 RepID=A0A5C6D7V9_9BACT|nr:hypothetical protein [Novipirellula artificiosorum]TWU31791.1 hypothetical protein Poly41_60260 [Novipirellula artificiosorum]